LGAEDVKVIQDIYGDFGRGDIGSMLGKLSDDVEFISPGTLPWAGRHHGHEAVAAFFQRLGGALDITRFEPREFLNDGDKVAVIGFEAATSRSTGRSFEMDFVHVWTVRDGQACPWHDFYDTGVVASVLDGQ
jgi:ketosteroid isomerase-like protein